MTIEQTILDYIVGGTFAGLVIASIIFTFILSISLYIYGAIVWMNIAKKLKHKFPWIAWIPFARTGLILKLGKFPWPLAFLYLIPIVGWMALFILIIIAKWRVFERRKYLGWLSLAILVPKFGYFANAVILGFVAWKDNNKKIRRKR